MGNGGTEARAALAQAGVPVLTPLQSFCKRVRMLLIVLELMGKLLGKHVRESERSIEGWQRRPVLKMKNAPDWAAPGRNSQREQYSVV